MISYATIVTIPNAYLCWFPSSRLLLSNFFLQSKPYPDFPVLWWISLAFRYFFWKFEFSMVLFFIKSYIYSCRSRIIFCYRIRFVQSCDFLFYIRVCSEFLSLFSGRSWFRSKLVLLSWLWSKFESKSTTYISFTKLYNQ